MKLVLRQKSFPNHLGRPGHQGGSLPRGTNAFVAQGLKSLLGRAVDVNHRSSLYEFDGETRNSNDIVITDNKTGEIVVVAFDDVQTDKLFLKSIYKSKGHGILGVRVVRAIKTISDKSGKPIELYADNDYWKNFDFFDNIEEFRSGETAFLTYTPKMTVLKGGEGSGFHGHVGRPGLVGGSLREGRTENLFGNDTKRYQQARNYIRGIYEGNTLSEPWQIHNQFKNATKQKKDYGADTSGLTIYVYGESDEPFDITPEQFNQLYDEVAKERDARIKFVQDVAGVEDWEEVLRGFSHPEEALYGLSGDDRDEAFRVAAIKARQIADRIKENGYSLAQFTNEELEYRVFDNIEKQLTDKFGNADKQYQYLNEIGRKLAEEHEFEVKHQIALGNMEPMMGHDLGVYQAEKPQGNEWQPLPGVLYHAATNSQAIENDQIRSRRELGQNLGPGLGGGEDDTISFGDDITIVKNIERALHEAHLVAKGDVTINDMVQMAKDGAGNNGKPYDKEFFTMLNGEDHPSPAFLRMLEAEKVGGTTEWPKARLDENRWDYYHLNFARTRQLAGGFPDPLFFSTDWKSLANLNPDNFATLVFNPNEGARGYQMGSLSEWRTVGGDTVHLTHVIQFYESDDLYNILGWDKYKTW